MRRGVGPRRIPRLALPGDLVAAPLARALQLKVGDVLGVTIKTWWKNFVPFAVMCLLVNAPVFLLRYWVGAPPSPFSTPPVRTSAEMSVMFERLAREYIVIFAQMGLSLIATGALTYGVLQSLRQKPVRMLECLRMGFARLLPVLGTAVLVFLLIELGIMLCIVPGIIFACRYAVALPVAVIEKPGVSASLRRSRDLTMGNKANIFLLYFIVMMIQSGVGFVLVLLTLSMGLLGAMINLAFGVMIGGSMMGVLGAVLYHELRRLKEGASIDEIAKVFD